MTGLWKLHAIATNQQAWRDWHKLVALAEANGVAVKSVPPADAGWKRLDRHAAKLNDALISRGIETGLGYSHIKPRKGKAE